MSNPCDTICAHVYSLRLESYSMVPRGMITKTDNTKRQRYVAFGGLVAAISMITMHVIRRVKGVSDLSWLAAAERAFREKGS